MTKILLTGGSGFIAAHILDQLLKAGHTVVTTVRSESKAAPIRAAYSDLGADRLQIVLVPDIAQANAFDDVVKNTSGLEVVLHTASPFHFRVTDIKRDLLDPAIVGTTGILKAVATYAPSVRRVVITSSFAAILDRSRLTDPNTTFSEASWNPVKLEQVTNAQAGYTASKAFAEKAAWDFVAAEKPKFDLVTVNPPLVFGPVVHHLEGLTAINTSNERIVQALTGAWKNLSEIPDTGIVVYVDVRDVATAHVRAALERPAAGGKRLLAIAGYYSNRKILEVLRKHFPEYADNYPPESTPGGGIPDNVFKFDNTATRKLLDIDWISIEKSIVDTAASLIPYLTNEGK